jgi:hypothetical protein
MLTQEDKVRILDQIDQWAKTAPVEELEFDEEGFRKNIERLKAQKAKQLQPKSRLTRQGYRLWERIREGKIVLPDWLKNEKLKNPFPDFDPFAPRTAASSSASSSSGNIGSSTSAGSGETTSTENNIKQSGT